MVARRRGVLSLLFLSALVILSGLGERYASAPPVARAQSAGIESWQGPLPSYAPRHLVPGDRSHAGFASANPATFNGYCIAVQSSTAFAYGPNHGFTVNGGSIIVQDPFPATAIEPNLYDTDYFDNDTPQTNDDYYCVVVTATTLPDVETLAITWTYEDNGEIETTPAFEVQIVRVDLVGVDGVVGGSAEVCTSGWEPSILTGHTSNMSQAGLLDPQDDVVAEDWVISPNSVYMLPESNPTPFRKGQEWCIAIAADVTTLDIEVELRYDAVYNPETDADDTPGNGAFGGHIAGPVLVDINEVSYSELRHISLGGQIMQSQAANWNVYGSRHTACIIPSTPDDILLPEDIVFLPAHGEIEMPTAVALTTFTNPDVDEPGHLAGVREGTWCFSWTSTSPGEQAIYLEFTKVGGQFPGPRFVSWDSNGDGNPDTDGNLTGPRNGSLVKKWNRINTTEITRGTDPVDNIVTNSTVVAPVVFNVSSGSYVFQTGAFSMTEWVYGSHRGPDGSELEGLLDGVILVARIDGGACGEFVSESNTREFLGPVINGISNNGRFDRAQYPLSAQPGPWQEVQTHTLDDDADTFPNPEFVGDGPDDIYLSITGDRNCLSTSIIRVRIDAYYPRAYSAQEPIFAHTEFVDIRLEFVVNQKVPTVAWAGEIVTINYGFAVGPSGCGAAGSRVHFVKQADAPGNFIPDFGDIVIGQDELVSILGDSCNVSARFESEQAGEIDIEAFLEVCVLYNEFLCPDDRLPGYPLNAPDPYQPNPYTKIAYPVYYLAIEDVTLSVSPEVVVSTFGDVSATVRGWFTGNNQSPREAVFTADGRSLPAGRWVLPDDWQLLRGDGDFRPGWPGSAPMPLTNVTFFMENEAIVNSPRNLVGEGIYNGAAGWFEQDGTETFFNVNPRTGETTSLGTEQHPRMLTDLTDNNGVATVDTYGDFNLGYQGCEMNAATGSPVCDLGDVVGQTRYYAIADYPQYHGQLPPVKTDVQQTDWTWAGYKTVTVENTDAASQKYVVVRMRDRDGYCDAINTNNVLGIPVQFHIDAGGGIIIEAQGQPVSYTMDGQGVIATTYDTQDDQGNPMNVEIVRPIQSDTGDECQVWVKISRSLPGTVNVEITIPGTPAPPVSDVRITGMQCDAQESFTVTNMGSVPVSLGGWALRGIQRTFGEVPHLGLDGVLQPGESTTFLGGPNSSDNGWIDSDSEIVANVGANPPGYVTLVWQNLVMGRATCPSAIGLDPVFEYLSPLPESLPSSGEGELQFSVNVEFGTQVSHHLVAGWNLIGGSTTSVPLHEAIEGNEDKLISVYSWDNAAGEWKRYFAGAPEYLNTLTDLEPGVAYWVQAREAFTLSIPE